jgi:hypothetical protein
VCRCVVRGNHVLLVCSLVKLTKSARPNVEALVTPPKLRFRQRKPLQHLTLPPSNRLRNQHRLRRMADAGSAPRKILVSNTETTLLMVGISGLGSISG